MYMLFFKHIHQDIVWYKVSGINTCTHISFKTWLYSHRSHTELKHSGILMIWSMDFPLHFLAHLNNDIWKLPLVLSDTQFLTFFKNKKVPSLCSSCHLKRKVSTYCIQCQFWGKKKKCPPTEIHAIFEK